MLQLLVDTMSMMNRGSNTCVLTRRDDRAFTLVELLVVLAVLTVFMAILLPTLQKARSLAQRAVCQNNLKQITTAWHMYLDAHDGLFFQGENANALYGGWRGLDFPSHQRPLNKYLELDPLPTTAQEARVFKCPGDKGHTGPVYHQDLGTSYQTNILLIGQDQIAPLEGGDLSNEINRRLKGLKRQAVDNPGRVLLIGDYGWGVQWIPGYPAGPYWHNRHDCYNLAYLDGHVRFLRVHKGLFITDEYTVLPFEEVYGLARDVQEEEKK